MWHLHFWFSYDYCGRGVYYLGSTVSVDVRGFGIVCFWGTVVTGLWWSL